MRRALPRQAFRRFYPWIGRLQARDTLLKARNEWSKTAVLPPYVTASELRVMLHLDYASTFRLLGVRSVGGKKFYWTDHEGRSFETVNKRKVMVSIEIAAKAIAACGLDLRMLDVEPDWTDAELEKILSGLL